jgi:hypothetical protein
MDSCTTSLTYKPFKGLELLDESQIQNIKSPFQENKPWKSKWRKIWTTFQSDRPKCDILEIINNYWILIYLCSMPLFNSNKQESEKQVSII